MVTVPNLALFHQEKKVWKLRDPTVRKDYETFVNEKCIELFSNEKPMGVNDAWNKVKTSFKWCKPNL